METNARPNPRPHAPARALLEGQQKNVGQLPEPCFVAYPRIQSYFPASSNTRQPESFSAMGATVGISFDEGDEADGEHHGGEQGHVEAEVGGFVAGAEAPAVDVESADHGLADADDEDKGQSGGGQQGAAQQNAGNQAQADDDLETRHHVGDHRVPWLHDDPVIGNLTGEFVEAEQFLASVEKKPAQRHPEHQSDDLFR